MKHVRLFLVIVIAELLIAVLATHNYGFTMEGLQATTRFSGRFSLALFSVIFILLPRNRKQLHFLLTEKALLAFAVAHGIHLLELLSYVYLSNATLIPVRLAGGFLAYVLIFILPGLQVRVLCWFCRSRIRPERPSAESSARQSAVPSEPVVLHADAPCPAARSLSDRSPFSSTAWRFRGS